MFKNITWKTILLTSFLTLFGWGLFWEIKETITGERMFFIVRWLYSEPRYAKYVEIHTYLLTDEQVAYMLSHPDDDVHQPNEKDLYMKYLNVVLRFKNHSDSAIWGNLSWRLNGGGWEKMNIDLPPVHAKNVRKFESYIIPMGIDITTENESPPEPIETKWNKLYRYP